MTEAKFIEVEIKCFWLNILKALLPPLLSKGLNVKEDSPFSKI